MHKLRRLAAYQHVRKLHSKKGGANTPARQTLKPTNKIKQKPEHFDTLRACCIYMQYRQQEQSWSHAITADA